MTAKVNNWIKRHLQVFFYTLGQFNQNRVNISMTILALGIGFSIPLSMYSVVDSFSKIGSQWQERPQITLYLEKNISEQQISELKERLQSDQRLQDIQYISASDGLKSFSAQFQFDQALSLLDENPLPAVFVVFPKTVDKANTIASLTEEFSAYDKVNSAQYDFEWLQKLSALTSFLKRAVMVLASVIAVGLLLLIANTIRLEIATRRDEIDIIDQLGGTPAFISRPFLYMGLLEGMLGGLAAVLISSMVLKLLSAPLLRLADLYGVVFNLPALHPDIVMIVLLCSGLLGWLSAKFTVSQHLRHQKPV